MRMTTYDHICALVITKLFPFFLITVGQALVFSSPMHGTNDRIWFQVACFFKISQHHCAINIVDDQWCSNRQPVGSFTLMAIHYPGLEITHMLLLFARFDIFQRGAFGHPRDVLLSLGSPATCTLASLDFLTGHRKVTLIQFYHPFQCIPCIPVAHRPAEFVYHRPYRFVTLQS